MLRRYIRDESVDLVYLDPPFNSNANYNVLFAEQDGSRAASQLTAFEDTWHWDQVAAATYGEVVELGGRVANALRAMRTFLGDSDMLAYLSMMAPRLVELRRVLKQTGSIYLHCDSTASHYLKLLMDAVFGPANFGNEIIWQRANAKGLASTRFARNHDVILRFTKTNHWTWNAQYVSHDPEYVRRFYRHYDENGRRYQLDNLTNPNKDRPNLTYDFLGVRRVWRWSEERMQQAYADGLIVQAKPGGVPRLKRYLDEQEGTPVGDIWSDILPLQAQGQERLGYPTQKPLALLERIINASSNPGDTVLDPFCGCGTAIDAAQRLGREWIGIDITHLAIGLIKHRFVDAYGPEITKTYAVIGEPTDLAGARELAASDPYQFQWWALGLVGARPVDQKKGADQGIDGRRFFHDDQGGATKQAIYSIKAGHVHRNMVAELRGVVEREKAVVGVLISMNEPTTPMRSEAASAGFYTDPWGGKHACLQLFTIADLLDGKQPDITRSLTRNTSIRQAPKAGRPLNGRRRSTNPSNLSLFDAEDLGDHEPEEQE